MLERLDVDLEVTATETDGAITVNLSGPDRPLLLSNTAAVLNSLEYLTVKAFRAGKDSRITAIQFDSDSYRQHREAELKLLAEMAARKVVAQRRAMTLQPMNPRERRIVHLALNDIEGVRSISDGEGENRSVTIYPA